jgi:hypothetical protein
LHSLREAKPLLTWGKGFIKGIRLHIIVNNCGNEDLKKQNWRIREISN